MNHARLRIWLILRGATGRLFLAVALGLFATLIAGHTSIPWFVRAVVGWDTGSLLLCVLAWIPIFRSNADQTRLRAAAEDPGRAMVWVIALGSSLFSLFAAVVVLRRVRAGTGAEFAAEDAHIWILFALVAIVLSWLLTHTAYTLRYAHLYYRQTDWAGCGGLQFPGDQPPTDIDFAYFAFTIGMCFQVSDVVITDSRIRRAVLVHALLSFLYNTTILALALNLAFAMLS